MTPADKERWQRVKLVLDTVLEEKPSKRAKILDRICGEDDALRREVQALLEQEGNDDSFLERPLLEPRLRGRAEDTPPERIRSYRLTGHIGEGGMGFVYRVTDDAGKSFALKRVPASKVSEETLKRFQREARTMAKLHHPNIVSIVSAGEQDGDPFILMELLEGETLSNLLRREGQVELALVFDVARQVAEALGYAHELGVLHRDLKPANLFRTLDGAIKVLDFGIAKPLPLGDDGARSGVTRLTKTGEVLGSPNYMAPEQARGEPVDARADLFSLGSILYEMLTGELAVRGDSLAARINALLVEEPAPLVERRVDAPPKLAALVHQCLSKDPDGRPASAAVFLESLQSAQTVR